MPKYTNQMLIWALHYLFPDNGKEISAGHMSYLPFARNSFCAKKRTFSHANPYNY